MKIISQNFCFVSKLVFLVWLIVAKVARMQRVMHAMC